MSPQQQDSISDASGLSSAERLIRLEVHVGGMQDDLKELKSMLESHIKKDSDLFYRYGWPVVQLLIMLALVGIAGYKSVGG